MQHRIASRSHKLLDIGIFACANHDQPHGWAVLSQVVQKAAVYFHRLHLQFRIAPRPPSWLAMFPQKFSAATTSTTLCRGDAPRGSTASKVTVAAATSENEATALSTHWT